MVQSWLCTRDIQRTNVNPASLLYLVRGFGPWVDQASAIGIKKGRLPPPLNLFLAIILFGVGLVGEICYWIRRCYHWFQRHSGCAKNGSTEHNSDDDGDGGRGGGGGGGDDDGRAPAHGQAGSRSKQEGHTERQIDKNADDAKKADGVFTPLSQRKKALIGGALERLMFACTMGLVALVLSTALWVVSIPSITGRIVRWMSVSWRKPASPFRWRI